MAVCRFTVDHILPLAHGGTDDSANLCLACFHCNRRKSDMISATDPVTGELLPLFHPRHAHWNDHFIWSTDKLSVIDLTPTGRATITLLDLNRERAIRIRAADIMVDRHPPDGDNMMRLP